MNNKLDIYSFMNSSAIAKHCRNINHRFSTLDMAYLIWASKKHSVAEKHTAWQALTNTQPDTEVAKRPWTPYIKSLHSFLIKFMELENKYINLFYQNEPNCVYSYSIWYPADEDYSHDLCIFPTFKICFKAIQAEITDYLNFYGSDSISAESLCILVKKQWINQSCDTSPKYLTIYIDSQAKPWGIYGEHEIISDTDQEILNAFKGIWIEVPTPFKKGDILISQSKHNRDRNPFILEWIPNWIVNEHSARTIEFMRTKGDHTDMCANIYSLDENGICRFTHGPNYLEMDYYTDGLTNEQ